MMMRKCSGSMMRAWMPMLWWAKMINDRYWSGVVCRPTKGASSAECGAGTRRKMPTDIVDKAVATGFLSTLVEAVRKAGLAETLKKEGPFTVFAPSDEAFSKLPEGVLQSILKDETRLKQMLTYHVVPGRYDASSLKGIASLKTVEGGTLEVDTRVGTKIGSAQVIQPDIFVSNGVIHVIDSVLIPAGE